MRDPNSIIRSVIGWCAVVLGVSISCFWAFWGINELFHEGWWATSFLGNLGFVIYLTPAVIPMVLALAALRWPRVGGTLTVLSGVALLIWWRGYAFHRELSLNSIFEIVTIGSIVVMGMGIGYFIGRPQPARLAYGLVVGLPLSIIVIFGAEPVWRVSHRPNDGFLGERLVEGNGVKLVWAPTGPGWPDRPVVKYAVAQEIVSHLVEDGSSCADVPQNIWRLPTIDEAVHSLTRGGKNAGGEWNPVQQRATYHVRPDKESPLWNVHSMVIYWWTSSPVPEKDAVYGISYNGYVFDRGQFKPMGFRAVKEPKPPTKEPEK